MMSIALLLSKSRSPRTLSGVIDSTVSVEESRQLKTKTQFLKHDQVLCVKSIQGSHLDVCSSRLPWGPQNIPQPPRKRKRHLTGDARSPTTEKDYISLCLNSASSFKLGSEAFKSLQKLLCHSELGLWQDYIFTFDTMPLIQLLPSYNISCISTC